MAKTFKSEVVDQIILTLEERRKTLGRNLLKTDTIRDMCARHINLADEQREREELLDIGIKQVIQNRLYAHGYFSVDMGYFVKVSECTSLWYLGLILNRKDTTIEKKIIVRNRIKEIKGLAGQMKFVPDESGELIVAETKTKEELAADLEADAV